ncbi:MAG: DUF1311 domain-containing protein [Bacteroidales bacterium]|jgi:hypothetical protein|nr:DUF1311 domain-containing protein [Bacteroidales bacterium]
MAQTPMDSLILNSKKIDFDHLKQVSDRLYHSFYNCDSLSTGTTIELRYCLTVQLQRENSLLQKRLQEIIDTASQYVDDTMYNNKLFVEKIELTQEIWERYRFAYCNQCVGNFRYYEKADILDFLQCAIELTIKRREEIEERFSPTNE